MRDPDRILRITMKLMELWAKNPDERLGQLLNNYVFTVDALFYQEDDETEQQIDDIIATM